MPKKMEIHFTDEMILEVQEMSKLGLSFTEMAGYLGISRYSFYLHKKKNKKISDAVRKGACTLIREASTQLYKLMQEGNLRAIEKILENKAPKTWWLGRFADKEKEKIQDQIPEPVFLVSKESAKKAAPKTIKKPIKKVIKKPIKKLSAKKKV